MQHHHQDPEHPSSLGPASAELQQVLSLPPPDFSGDANNAAAVTHAALQALRDAGDPRFLFLRTILEVVTNMKQQQQQQRFQQSHDELLFHCITGCRHILLTKWTSFCDPFLRLVRDYFMTLGGTPTTNIAMSSFLRLALFNASASFWKRNWNEDTNSTTTNAFLTNISQEEQSLMDHIRLSQQQNGLNVPQLTNKLDLFRYLEEAMSPTSTTASGTTLDLASSSSFMTILVGEFAGKSASNYNMPLEFHKQAHRTFEKEGWLDQSLQMTMTALSHVVGLLNSNTAVNAAEVEPLALTVVQLTIDIISWEFGTDAWDSGGFPLTGGNALLKPPEEWRHFLIQPEFVTAIFRVHATVIQSNSNTSSQLAHYVRQLILLLASLNGPIFQSKEERKTFAAILLEGILILLSNATVQSSLASSESQLLDTLSMVSRLIVNYRLSVLVELPMMQSLHQGLSTLGRHLLQENLKECQAVHGDTEAMENREFREEALALLLEGIVLLCGDPWLLYSGSEESRKVVQAALASTLGPLYAEFVNCRTQMARLEETYLTSHETELDEVREEIYAVDLEDEMTSLSIVGRLDLQASLACLLGLFSRLIPQLQSLWNCQVGAVTADAAGLLEESRLTTMYIGHLLTDENSGETPVIPDAILATCQDSQQTTETVASAVRTLQEFAEFQASRIAAHPSDPRLSPLLAKAFLWFLNRWAPAYILPTEYGNSATQGSIVLPWSYPEQAKQSVSFILSLCLHYNCCWPQERQVQDVAASLILSMAKACSNLRLAMVESAPFRQLLNFHCLTCGIRHSAPSHEFENTVQSKAGHVAIDMTMIRGYQRLPYEVKGRLLTGILVACSEPEDAASAALLNDCFSALQEAFSALVNVLSTKQLSPDSVDAKEMTCLCVALYGGVARAGDMINSERIPTFLSPSLGHLSGLMECYADDLTICEGLLRLFRDYAEHFIAILDSESCAVLFRASSELLKSYSVQHCSTNRVILHSTEEEQKYDDVLCAIELLIQLGTKDFIDVGHQTGVNSTQVTEMIFMGLQQILPLMTRGLLQYPRLCTQFFSLVGFMLETYAEQVKLLPYDLFDALLESLLYGMSYHDDGIAKSSLQGLSGIAREHLKSRVLDVHIAASQNHEGIIDKCTRRLLVEVVFQNIIWDRMEAAGLALLPLAAIDINRFAAVVQGIAQQIPPEHQKRLISSFQGLLQPDVVLRVTSVGYEGRKNRILFKKEFETFCHEIHSFLLTK
ncbi:hypothetical protein IV203_030085 [Nitzschia inconspicua]|uniref:Exportin-4 n=1 Tax=Nitzschia inconspicua TaxID=303405 RepID=A0A9K3LRY2_9STRA|nr:hypothetical protein IV203_030085 [Nitzschia inconspicua]